jgi:hypothetical protein
VLATDPEPAVKFLGVYFDPQLNFKYHIKRLRNKLSKSLYALRSTKNFLSEKALCQLYFTMIHSHLIYAIQIWTCTSPSNFSEIEKIQKKAIRIVKQAKYNAHTEPLFKKLNILPFKDLVTFFKLQFMQRFIQGFLPPSFNLVWTRNNIRNIGENEILLRNHNDINIPFARLHSADRQPLFAFPKIWEDFPVLQIKFTRRKLEFDNILKKHFLSELSSSINCTRLFCPSCSL